MDITSHFNIAVSVGDNTHALVFLWLNMETAIRLLLITAFIPAIFQISFLDTTKCLCFQGYNNFYAR